MTKWIVCFLVAFFVMGGDVWGQTTTPSTSASGVPTSSVSGSVVSTSVNNVSSGSTPQNSASKTIPTGGALDSANALNTDPNNTYHVPNWADLVHSLVRLHAISLDDEILLDEYSIITQCDLYKYYYQDEFKWNKVRSAIVANTQEKQSTYPLAYSFDTRLQLNHYDFHQNIYVFSDKATLSHVNSIVMYEVNGPACGSADIRYMPRVYQVVFDTPVTVLGLPLSQSSAEALLELMKLEQNTDKIIYTRFNFHLLFADPYRRLPKSREVEYSQGSGQLRGHVRIDAHLDSVRFYDDEAETHLIFEYKP